MTRTIANPITIAAAMDTMKDVDDYTRTLYKQSNKSYHPSF